MAAVNYDKMSLKELLDHETKLRKAISAARDNERNQLKQRVTAMLQNAGFTPGEIFGGAKGGKNGKGSKVAVKFRNKDNPEETWTGRGRQPKWLAAKLQKGAKLADFAV